VYKSGRTSVTTRELEKHSHSISLRLRSTWSTKTTAKISVYAGWLVLLQTFRMAYERYERFKQLAVATWRLIIT